LPREAMTVELEHRLFTVDEYYRMAAAGILNEDDRVELIDGAIVHKPPIGSKHASVVDTLAGLLTSQLRRDQAIVRVQNPVRLNDLSELQPDISLLKPRGDRYKNAHPGTDDIFLVIEVAENSAVSDREVKIPRYARAAVPEVWLIYLNDQVVEVYRDPGEGEFRDQRRVALDESLSPLALPDVEVQVDDIVG
jgi:Uma2 family endonuclease